MLCLNVAFLLSAGPQEDFDCYPKMSKHFCFLFYIFKGYTCKKKCALACLKAKTEERERKKYVSHVQIKNHFAHFGRKIIKQI